LGHFVVAFAVVSAADGAAADPAALGPAPGPQLASAVSSIATVTMRRTNSTKGRHAKGRWAMAAFQRAPGTTGSTRAEIGFDVSRRPNTARATI
jgi:hypothetical protein